MRHRVACVGWAAVQVPRGHVAYSACRGRGGNWHERACQGAGRHVVGSSAGAQGVHWLGDSGNIGHVNTMQERRTWLRAPEAVWVQKGAGVWCVGSCAVAEKGALGSLKEAVVGVPKQGAGWRGVGLVSASSVLGGMDCAAV
jgi:hypothetical protein